MPIPNFTWLDSDEERYTDALEVLFPAAWRGPMFLMGEPMDHTDEGHPTYTVHTRSNAGVYRVGSRCVTVREFDALYTARSGA